MSLIYTIRKTGTLVMTLHDGKEQDGYEILFKGEPSRVPGPWSFDVARQIASILNKQTFEKKAVKK